MTIIILLIIIYIIYSFLKEKIEKNKENIVRKEKEIEEYDIKIVEPYIKKIYKKINKEISKKYLSYNLFNLIYNKYEEDYKAIVPYKSFFYDYYPIVYDFYQQKEFRKNYNKEYIKKYKEIYSDYYKCLDKNKHWLTDKQMDAVFSDEDSTLVNAGAGTWKTKTIESKLLHLIDHKKIPLDQVLVVTFSKKSQEDMLLRIKESLSKAGITYNNDELKSTVSTFHAFWKNILDENSLLNINSTKEVGKWSKKLGVLWEWEWREILRKVFVNIRKKSLVQKLIATFLLRYIVPQVSVQRFKNLNEYYQHTKKSLKTMLKDGEYYVTVKSYGEYLIANYLWENNIEVQYEPRDHYYTDNGWNKRNYRPDFYLPEYDIYIEYFGLDKYWRTAPYVAQKEYVKRVEQKIAAHRKSGNKLIDIRYGDLQDGEDIFLEKFSAELSKMRVIKKQKSTEEILEIQEACGQLEWVSKLLTIFLALYKESASVISELKQKAKSGFDPLNISRNILFLKIFEAFEDEYNSILEKEWYMDFGDMIYKAADLIEKRKVRRKFKYILVDEFQDISQARARFLQELIAQNFNCKLFCVWDDWQSIYQFSGSDTDIFFNFDQYFWYTNYIVLDKTFRFNKGISDISWSFIMMNPEQKTKVLKSNDISYKWKVKLYQKEPTDAWYFFDIIQDIARDSPYKKEISVFLITRYSSWKYKDWFFDMIKKKYSQEKKSNVFKFMHGDQKIVVTHTTSHKSKWLEADYVIVDYINQWWKYEYNFPSSFEDDPILLMITKDGSDGYLFAEERRIFYVSMTRWKQKSYLVYTAGKQSTFIEDIVKLWHNEHRHVLEIAPSISENSIQEIEKLPNCPDCKWKLRIRSNKDSWEKFWGCSNYPNCTYTEKIF